MRWPGEGDAAPDTQWRAQYLRTLVAILVAFQWSLRAQNPRPLRGPAANGLFLTLGGNRPYPNRSTVAGMTERVRHPRRTLGSNGWWGVWY